jgi:hypothetical protein
MYGSGASLRSFWGEERREEAKLKGEARESRNEGRWTEELKVVKVVAFVFRCV